MTTQDRKAEAERLFFVEKKTPKEIAEMLGVHLQTIRGYIRNNEGYNAEKQRRKAENKGKAKAYKLAWDRKNRSTGRIGTGEEEKTFLKSQHCKDVRILSHEKY